MQEKKQVLQRYTIKNNTLWYYRRRLNIYLVLTLFSASAPTTTVHPRPSSKHERKYRLPAKWRTVHYRYGLAEHNCDACCTTEPRATVHKTPCMVFIHQQHTTMISRAIIRSRGQGNNALGALGLRFPHSR